MIIQSAYPELGPLEVPDGCRVEQVPASNEASAKTVVWAKKRSGGEYILVRDSAFRDGHRPSRRWFDERGNIHRDEKSGPAVVDIFYQEYFKHGKRHRIGGPQLVNSTGTKVYCLEGQELTRALWEDCVKNNGGKPSKVCKGSIDALKSTAALLSAEARRLGRVNSQVIPKEELHELDEAAKPESWKRHGAPELRPDGNSLVCLDCEPLDDTLRCYIVIAKDGETILAARLEVE